MMSNMVTNGSKNKETASFMRKARKTLRLTQWEMAARLGKNRDNIAKYETGATNTPGDVILRVRELIDCDIRV